jgi:hypothetical protein
MRLLAVRCLAAPHVVYRCVFELTAMSPSQPPEALPIRVNILSATHRQAVSRVPVYRKVEGSGKLW